MGFEFHLEACLSTRPSTGPTVVYLPAAYDLGLQMGRPQGPVGVVFEIVSQQLAEFDRLA